MKHDRVILWCFDWNVEKISVILKFVGTQKIKILIELLLCLGFEPLNLLNLCIFEKSILNNKKLDARDKLLFELNLGFEPSMQRSDFKSFNLIFW